MKIVRLLLMVTLLFVISAPAFATEQTLDTGALSYASGGTSLRCTETWGCPACVSDMAEVNSMCAKIRFANGWCQCGDPKAVTASRAVCGILKGSCTFLW